jgi:spore maturation protein SpmB
MIKKTYFEMFVDGCRDGWKIGIFSLLPNLVMAFTLIKILEDTGALKFLGQICAPLTAIFGLPGEAMMVLITALLSMGGGTGIAMSLFTSGILSAADLTIVLPGIFLLGGQIQNVGRILGVIGIAPRFYPLLWGVTLLNAAMGMVVMRFFVKGF